MEPVYTITGAADWPILLVAGGLLMTVIGFMWRDLRAVVKEYKQDNVQEHKEIWSALRECQKDHNK